MPEEGDQAGGGSSALVAMDGVVGSLVLHAGVVLAVSFGGDS